MTDTLLDFLRTGEFDGLRAGQPLDVVRHVVGKPDDVTTSGDLWLYGDQSGVNIQLPVRDDRIAGIWLYFRGLTNTDALPRCFSAQTWTINGQTGLDEFTEQLTMSNIEWRIHGSLTFSDQTCVLTQSNVHCLWSNDGRTHLEKILFTADGVNGATGSGRPTR